MNNDQDIIDSRELVEFIEGNEGVLTESELKPYRDFAEEFEDCAPDFHHGKVAIRYDHFTEYCRELTADLGWVPEELPWWINSAIDWDAVADGLSVDYSIIEFDGVEYYVR